MKYGYIDKTGIHTAPYDDILADRKDKYRGIFGADVYLEPDSQEGQLMAMEALAINDCCELAVSVYNAFSPLSAQGTGLSRMVLINGIARLSGSYSTVDLTLVGQAGTVIANGVAQDVAEQFWDLPASVVIPTSGEITVTATAREQGAVQAGAGEITTISTPTLGWQSVTNALAATPGAEQEKDPALKARQQVSTALPSRTVLDGIVGGLANLSGVTRVMGYENDKKVADANGQAPNSIAMVVEGGDATAIADVIARKKAPGVATEGTVAVTVEDSQGMPKSIRFYRPAAVPVQALITITPLNGYVSTTAATIVSNLVAYFNGLAVGEDVLRSKLYTPINAAEPSSSRRTFDVESLLLARTGEAAEAASVAIEYVELATITADDITVTPTSEGE